MNKYKQLFLSFLSLVAFGFSWAQCNIDPNASSIGFSPDPLPDGQVGTAYSQDVTGVFPADTVLFGFTLAIDSVQITGVQNLAPGLQYTCQNNNCSFLYSPGQLTKGCFLLNGTPSASASIDTIIVTFSTYVTVPFVGVQSFPLAYPIPFKVIDATAVEVKNTSSLVYPNPAQDVLNIQDAKLLNKAYQILDLKGQVLQAGILNQDMQISLNALAKGMYILKVEEKATRFLKD